MLQICIESTSSPGYVACHGPGVFLVVLVAGFTLGYLVGHYRAWSQAEGEKADAWQAALEERQEIERRAAP